jgi:hypothetical protein
VRYLGASAPIFVGGTMIDYNLIVVNVENLITAFEEQFPNSTIFKRNRELMKNNLAGTISILFNDLKVVQDFEGEIHQSILQALSLDIHPLDVDIDRTKVGVWDYMIAVWGEEIGTLLLICNKAIRIIAREASMQFDERVEKALYGE